MSIIEVIAIAFALAYVWLLAKQEISCWYGAFFSSSLYVYILWRDDLYMEVGLNIFYAVMAVVGWYQWRQGGPDKQGARMRRLSLNTHLMILLAILVSTVLTGWVLDHDSNDPMPYLESALTWASVLTTFLVIWKVLESWWYWMAIYALSVYLYTDQELYMTAALFAAYTLLAVKGNFEWRRAASMEAQAA